MAAAQRSQHSIRIALHLGCRLLHHHPQNDLAGGVKQENSERTYSCGDGKERSQRIFKEAAFTER
jgi:hypothetical protein